MNKVVVITGASSGLGQEMARIYLAKGYSLVLNGRNEEGFKEFQAKENIKVVVGDLTKQETIDQIALAVDVFGRLDILINNAGILYSQPFEENTPEQLDKVLAICLKAPMLLTQKLYPVMVAQKNGTIVNINSGVGKEARANFTLYCAAKFGLNGFTQSLRLEARPKGIRVLSIHPGGIKTNLWDHVDPNYDTSGFMETKKVAELIVTLSETEGLSPDEIVINRLTK